MQPATPENLAVFLGAEFDDTDTARAQMILDGVTAQALTVVVVGAVPETGPTAANLPDAASSVIYGAAGRAFLNPAGATQEVAGSASIARPSNTGSLLSAAEKAVLRALGGTGSGVFSVDLLAGSGFSTLGSS